jgi:hypothetical protein
MHGEPLDTEENWAGLLTDICQLLTGRTTLHESAWQGIDEAVGVTRVAGARDISASVSLQRERIEGSLSHSLFTNFYSHLY